MATSRRQLERQQAEVRHAVAAQQEAQARREEAEAELRRSVSALRAAEGQREGLRLALSSAYYLTTN